MAMGRDRQAKLLAIVNRKGGVGKTTTAVNLAHGLSRKLLRRVEPADLEKVPDTGRLYRYHDRTYYINGHVLLVDFDPQGHCARALGVATEDADVGELLIGRQQLGQAVVTADRASHGYPRPNLWILPASDRLEQAKEALRSQSLEFIITGHDSKEEWLQAVLRKRLEHACERFSFIIFDCAPGMDIFTRAVCQFAGAAIVPVKPDYLSMTGVGQDVGDVSDLQLQEAGVRIHCIVPTFAVERQRLDREMIAELKRKHGSRVCEPIPRSQLVAEAPGYQQSVFEVDARYFNPATIAYQNLVDRVFYG